MKKMISTNKYNILSVLLGRLTIFHLHILVICLLLGTITPVILASQHSQIYGQQVNNGSIPSFQHIFFIIEENHDYNQIIGSSGAPYINQLANKYGLATAFHAISHPSLPNYIALTSGGLQGITTDCSPGGSCSTGATNIFSELEQGGKTWKAYMEGMPGNCAKADGGTGYVVHHNPPAYYTNLSSCAKNDVPYTQFATDLSGNTLPTFSWIVPNVQNDMHNGTIQAGDSWLAKEVSAILGSTAFTNNGLLIITTDEGLKGAGNTNQVFTIIASPLGKPAFKSAVAYDHYSLLRTIAEGLGVAAPGSAANATPMSDFFGASGPQPTSTSPQPSISATITPTTNPKHPSPTLTQPTGNKTPSPTANLTSTPSTISPSKPKPTNISPNPTGPKNNPCPNTTGTTGKGANEAAFNPSTLTITPKNCSNQNAKDNDKQKNNKKDNDNKRKSSAAKSDSIFQPVMDFFYNLFK